MWIYAVCFVTGYLEILGTIQIFTDFHDLWCEFSCGFFTEKNSWCYRKTKWVPIPAAPLQTRKLKFDLEVVGSKDLVTLLLNTINASLVSRSFSGIFSGILIVFFVVLIFLVGMFCKITDKTSSSDLTDLLIPTGGPTIMWTYFLGGFW